MVIYCLNNVIHVSLISWSDRKVCANSAHLKEQSDLGLHSLLLHFSLLEANTKVESLSLTFKVLTAVSVQKLMNFMIILIKHFA